MGIIDELSRLNQLRESGALTDLEFEHAKAIALQEAAILPASPQIQIQKDDVRLEILELENQLLKLGQDWDRERETLMVHTKSGKVEPNKKEQVYGPYFALCFVGVVFFVVGMVRLSIDASGGMLIFCGVILLLMGLFVGSAVWNQAEQYEQAKKRYLDARAICEEKLSDAKRRLP